MKVRSTTTCIGVFLASTLCLIGGVHGQSSGNPQQSVGATTEGAAIPPEILRELSRQAEITRSNNRIVNGEPVAVSDHPWQVALIQGRFQEPQRSQFCGGTLIRENWVLTAAHCIDSTIVRKDPRRVDVVAGSALYAVGGERLKVTQVVIHPQWDDSTSDFDFALLRLSAPSRLGKPINLADENLQVSAGTRAWVTGWGATTENGPGSLTLLGAEIPVVSTEVCNRPESYDGDITVNMLCAGRQEGGVDSCQGDSGGPLSTTNQGRKVLVGVVSFGQGCARRLKYGVYGRVSKAAGWISSTLSTAGTR